MRLGQWKCVILLFRFAVQGMPVFATADEIAGFFLLL
jgi:hypothetical protein